MMTVREKQELKVLKVSYWSKLRVNPALLSVFCEGFWIIITVKRQTDALVTNTLLRGRAKQPQCFWLIHF